MKILMVLFAFAFSAFAAPVPKESKKPGPEQFQGSWVIVGIVDEAHRQQKTESGATLIFEGNNLAIHSPGGREEKCSTEFGFKESTTTLDVTTKRGVILGIVKLDGNTLLWSRANGGEVRPTEFSSGNDRTCFLLQRVEKK